MQLPEPRTPDPMDAPPLRWGVLGPGWIADQMVGSLRANTKNIEPGLAQYVHDAIHANAARHD